MSAEMAVQAAVVAALRAALGGDVSGVFDGPPARAACPYVAIDDGQSGDWSSKTGRGREHRLAIRLADDGTSAARLHGLIARSVTAIEAIPQALPGHRIASLVFLRQRVARTARGPWAGLIEFRIRTAEQTEA
ncbi:MAG: DUF3168 domain-containing protein [Sphingomonas fennica]